MKTTKKWSVIVDLETQKAISRFATKAGLNESACMSRALRQQFLDNETVLADYVHEYELNGDFSKTKKFQELVSWLVEMYFDPYGITDLDLLHIYLDYSEAAYSEKSTISEELKGQFWKLAEDISGVIDPNVEQNILLSFSGSNHSNFNFDLLFEELKSIEHVIQ